MNAVLGGLAIALTFIAFIPYIRAIHRGQICPHVFSWVIWGSTTFVVFLAQLADKGGAGAWPIGVSGLITIYVAILAFVKKADHSITRSDWVFLIIAIIALLLWFYTADPLWTVLLLTGIDVIGFAPTLRKAYAQPHEEQLTFFVLMAMRNALVVLALEHYSITTLSFPVATGIACLMLIALVLLRRRHFAKAQQQSL